MQGGLDLRRTLGIKSPTVTIPLGSVQAISG